MSYHAGQHCHPGGVFWSRVPADLSARIRKRVAACGATVVRRELGVSETTLAELRDEGKLREHVIARIEARLTELGA